MPSQIQLFTPEQIKAAAAIDKNVYDRDIEVAAKVIQDEHVETALGTQLFDRMCELVKTEQIDDPDNEAYKYIYDTYLLPIVGWGTRAEVEPQLQNKVRNAGVTNSTDEHLNTVAQQTMYENMGRYYKRMKFYISEMINYIKCHVTDYSEYKLCGCDCDGVKPQRNGGNIAGFHLD